MISVLFVDCDGILTTGTYLYDDEGKQYKEFSSVDSNGIAEAVGAGITVEAVSADPTGDDINEMRCEHMGIPYHRAIHESKEAVLDRRLDDLDRTWEEVASMGDDVTDLEMLRRASVPITVPNAVQRVENLVREREGYVTERRGGRGAVAEAVRYLLDQRR